MNCIWLSGCVYVCARVKWNSPANKSNAAEPKYVVVPLSTKYSNFFCGFEHSLRAAHLPHLCILIQTKPNAPSEIFEYSVIHFFRVCSSSLSMWCAYPFATRKQTFSVYLSNIFYKRVIAVRWWHTVSSTGGWLRQRNIEIKIRSANGGGIRGRCTDTPSTIRLQFVD